MMAVEADGPVIIDVAMLDLNMIELALVLVVVLLVVMVLVVIRINPKPQGRIGQTLSRRKLTEAVVQIII